ncbi:hypothetical protein [Roseovarius ramblicola]|uniref:Uncharacterized protein n=1 Tax=Roseovarius ramblicola TaxID=2022336 RepID=A0ABV5I4G7_9RHOB
MLEEALEIQVMTQSEFNWASLEMEPAEAVDGAQTGATDWLTIPAAEEFSRAPPAETPSS